MTHEQKAKDFDSMRLRLASPDVIHEWSRGEVTKPETINYRTQKPEKNGLFCERIFGPSKDWECYCGKYKKIRYKGIVCDKCGVEITRVLVRRERMGHIDLASPVSHIWFLRGVPSSVGLALDISVQNLEKVIYFANFIITKVDEKQKEDTLAQIKSEYMAKMGAIKNQFKPQEGQKTDPEKLTKMMEEKMAELDELFGLAEEEIKNLTPLTIITESEYRDLSLKYGHTFEAKIGAEAIRELLAQLDPEKEAKRLAEELESASGAKAERTLRRLRFFSNLKNNKIKPEWMVLTAVPVIPPDLRPMVPLDGGRFATSDLNDLYRRVINRNNRLRQLIELNAPEVITRNERRMLQEAVDALMDNSARHGKMVTASTGQKRSLKSLSDMLKGKQGRFRQNLLGKRIDYSGRSVIVVGPELKLHQCGIPKKMALELFKPFIISRLIAQEVAHNVRSASRYIESGKEEVWDILEDVVSEAHVLLNRAPTLHRLGIQAFKPVLIEGKAIRIHPLVCSAFNADFDGDQMAVHVPLTKEAKEEAATIMLSSNNLLKPATGEPIVSPSQDIVWGAYYLTMVPAKEQERDEKSLRAFGSRKEALLAYDMGMVRVQERILLKVDKKMVGQEGRTIETTAGRILFNSILPEDLPYQNDIVGKKALKKVISLCLETCGHQPTVSLLDDLKGLSFKYLTKSGLSWGIGDLPNLKEKKEIVDKADDQAKEAVSQYEMGLLTEGERHSKIIELWTSVKEKITALSRNSLSPDNPIFTMIDSGARGTWDVFTQIVGMRGLMTNPAGDIIELPVRGSFQEGFDVLEYFISTHGARKGLADTALRTATAGYLTRRLVDVAQDVVVTKEDCKSEEGFEIYAEDGKVFDKTLQERLVGRVLAADLVEDGKKKPLLKAGTLVTSQMLRDDLEGKSISQATMRSALHCKAERGVCQRCYGYDLGKNDMVKLGTAVGIIAAQSIGEPGTQLTMRTFHAGGVAGQDITKGLPRVDELFETRTPKRRAFMSDVAGKVEIVTKQRTVKDEEGKVIRSTDIGQKTILIHHEEAEEKEFKVPKSAEVKVKDAQKVKKNEVLFVKKSGDEAKAPEKGIVKIEKSGAMKLCYDKKGQVEMIIPAGYSIKVQDGDLVEAGAALTDGNMDLEEYFKVRGATEVQRYIVNEIQYVYASEGSALNDKHIEVIVRQLFSKVKIQDAGDTTLVSGEIVDRARLMKELERVKKEKKNPAKYEDLLLGITKVSLFTDSFLSAASFQQTTRVLVAAALSGKVDQLRGLKENVIIGRLVPAGSGFEPK